MFLVILKVEVRLFKIWIWILTKRVVIIFCKIIMTHI